MPNISVIIPNFNNAHYVSSAIQSVLDQSHQDFEVIVVDDGSTDESRAVIGRFGERVRYLWQENQGLAGARNTGIRAAQGKWIGLLDADDQWLPTYLATVLALQHQSPNSAVYYCAAQCMDHNGHDLPRVLGEPLGTPETTYNTLIRANFLIPSTILMRRDVIMAAGLFDQQLRSCEDWDLWLRIAAKQRFVGTPERLARYRLHSASLSANVTGMHQAAQAVIEKNFGPDDQQRHKWSPEKRRAYGGLYRYFTLTLVQRQNNWETAGNFLREALQIDETIATDLDLFYELALGSQPIGYRGTAQELRLAFNLAQVEQMLQRIFAVEATPALHNVRRQTWGTAYYALGLASYNTGYVSESRRLFYAALRQRPELGRDRRLMGNLIRSLAGNKSLKWLRQLRQQYSA
jgi:glycosyltransferase involved in cell wall biosynthesis